MGTMMDTCSVSPESAPKKDSYTTRDTEGSRRKKHKHRRRKRKKKRRRKSQRKGSGSSSSSSSYSYSDDGGYTSVDSYEEDSLEGPESSLSKSQSTPDRKHRHESDTGATRKSSRSRRRKLSHSHSHRSHSHRRESKRHRHRHSHRRHSGDSDQGYVSSDPDKSHRISHAKRRGSHGEAVGYMMVPYTVDDKGRAVPMFGQIRGFTPMGPLTPLSPIQPMKSGSISPNPLTKIGSTDSVLSQGDSVKSLPITQIARPEIGRSLSNGYYSTVGHGSGERPLSAREATKRYSHMVQSRREARQAHTARRSRVDSPIRVVVQPPGEKPKTLDLTAPQSRENSEDSDLDEAEEAHIAAIVKQREKTRDSRHPTPGLHLMTTEELFADDDLDVLGASVDGDENIALTPRGSPLRGTTPVPSEGPASIGTASLDIDSTPAASPVAKMVTLDKDDIFDDPNFRKLRSELSMTTLPLSGLDLDTEEGIITEKQESTSSTLEVEDTSLPRKESEVTETRD